MFSIDRRKNIKITNGDTLILDFQLCGEKLQEGDKVIFKISNGMACEITTFDNGVAKFGADRLQINPGDYTYSIVVKMGDGRISTMVQANFKVEGVN